MNVTALNFSLARSLNAHGHPSSNLPKRTYGGGDVKVESDSALIQLWLKPLKASKNRTIYNHIKGMAGPCAGKEPWIQAASASG